MSKSGSDEKRKKQKTIVFLHPDLGIGGAERLVVDAAVGLQERGHRVVIYTSHCDPSHCFDEARDGTLEVRVRGNTIVPTTILGRFAILCAILRQLHLILHIALLTYELHDLAPDAFFVDQLSAGLPLLKSQSSAPIFFYCHFPDLLLAQGRARWWKRLYRVPFDTLEQWSMGFADAIAVNSGFTKQVVAKTWPSLARKRDLKIVYPCIDTSDKKPDPDSDDPLPWKESGLILSINRFERKKDIALAIRAFAGLPKSRRGSAKLIIAGGYDNRVPENVGYHAELVALADELSLQTATATNLVSALSPAHASAEVLFLLSVPDRLKEMLLTSAKLLVYTPSNEHFGIVPLEAMLRGVPVLAANNGGPTETIVDGVTGWLRDPEDTNAWSEVMGKALGGMKALELEKMGRKGTERVKSKFADVQMAETLDGIFDEIVAGKKETSKVTDAFMLLFSVAVVVGLISTVLGLYQRLKDMPKADYAS
ncbi:glycosyltransferase family 4 protein [Immersiella caudata]|uniref:Alpha-1,3/1,6-mannosyltransferase ALG2 n=1 Tax=Immersiella caudata TaxID=314043 RepID=A0AA39X442_9PEZI|nr:glycosyltransferase family 4 protein [Immersiella caudata]